MKRRDFLKATALASPAVHVPALLAAQSHNDTIGVALVGAGTRGLELLAQIDRCPGTEVRVISDVYAPNAQRAASVSANARVRLEKDWRKAIEPPDIDAVVVATPDFWHAPITIAAAELRKDVYTEKGLCRGIDDAKRIRAAVEANRVVFQLGHQHNSDAQHVQAREIYRGGRLGKVATVRASVHRDSALREWRHYTAHEVHRSAHEATPDSLDWDLFLGSAAAGRGFDPERFFRWRNWWEYGNGIAGDLMSTAWDAINGIAGMGIPESVATHSGLPHWTGGREVPDTWHAVFEYPSKSLAIEFHCDFHGRARGGGIRFLGSAATLDVDASGCRLGDVRLSPALPRVEHAHMRNFVECVRSRAVPECGLGRAWENAVAVAMSVESYRRQRWVAWDGVREAIV